MDNAVAADFSVNRTLGYQKKALLVELNEINIEIAALQKEYQIAVQRLQQQPKEQLEYAKNEMKLISNTLAKSRRQYSDKERYNIKVESETTKEKYLELLTLIQKFQNTAEENEKALSQFQNSDQKVKIDQNILEIKQLQREYSQLKEDEKQLYNQAMDVIAAETMRCMDSASNKLSPLMQKLENMRYNKSKKKVELFKLIKTHDDEIKKLQNQVDLQKKAKEERQSRMSWKKNLNITSHVSINQIDMLPQKKCSQHKICSPRFQKKLYK